MADLNCLQRSVEDYDTEIAALNAEIDKMAPNMKAIER